MQTDTIDWKELPSLSNEDLEALGIAAVHLACAAGLPGAEDLAPAVCLRQLEEWTDLIEYKTEELFPIFEDNPERFEFSEARFRMLALVTVLQRDLGIHGDKKLSSNDFSNGRDLFLHGLLETRAGNCSTLPVLYAALGRSLGYPQKLAKTAHHLFARWEDPDGKERFNIECTVRGLDTPPDEYYLSWPVRADPDEARAGFFLKSKSPRDELAGFLIQRAYCLLHNHRYREAVDACLWACVAAPENGMHVCSAWRMRITWRHKLEERLPLMFPTINVLPPSPRGYPEVIPLEVECDVITLKVMEHLLNDPVKELMWWGLLRSCPTRWPANVPTSIQVSGEHRT